MVRLRQQARPVIEFLSDTPPPSPSPATKAHTVDSTTLLSEATRGTVAARQILSTANEAHTVAVETAERLQQQTKQLENVAMLVDDTRAHLDSAEVTIDKLTLPIWRRKLGRRKATVQSSGDRSITSITSITFARVRGGRKEKHNVSELHREPRGLVKLVDSYDDFEAPVRAELQAQDELLTDTAVVVEELRLLAIGIGDEIEKEAEIVEGIEVEEVSGRIRESSRKLRDRLKLR